MPACESHETQPVKPLKRGLRAVLVLCALLLAGGGLWAADKEDSGRFAVLDAHTNLKDGVYLLQAELEYSLSETVKEALLSGVPITLVLDIQILRKRRYWWDEHVADIQLRYRLRYHTLTERYLVTYQNTKVQESFGSLYSALRAISGLKDFPLVDKNVIKNRYTYSVQLSGYLDIEALPAPLQTVAYFSDAWRLIGGEHSCALTR